MILFVLFSRTASFFFSAIFIAAGASLFFLAPSTDSDTQGIITQVEVVEREDDEKDQEPTCKLHADFTVNNVSYQAESMASSPMQCDRTVGDTVKVRYNSEDPKENDIGPALLVPIVSAVFAGIGLCIFIGGFILAPKLPIPTKESLENMQTSVAGTLSKVTGQDLGVNNPPAGWYPHGDGTQLRWWNGTHWTEHIHSGVEKEEPQ